LTGFKLTVVLASSNENTGGLMAKNTGQGSRIGAVRQRSQTYNPRTHTWAKRGPGGTFMGQKADGTPFKGVTKEK
jgi:hypothetical protein